MSQINFGSFVDMLTIATPSGGYIVAYDLDGILKQKDFFGNVVEIGGGPTSGSATSSLSSVLSTGNNSGPYSIIMGTSTSISSSNGGGSLNLDNMGASAVSLSTDNGSLAETYLFLTPESVKLNYKYSTTQTLLQAGTAGEFLLNSPQSMTLHVNSVDFISSNIATVSTTDTAKYSTIISSRNSTINNNVLNSIILGGQNLTASSNDTVYISSLNINNAYTLPSTDGTNGHVLRTDGSGNVSWQAFASSGTNLGQTLATGNTSSGYNIVLSDGDYIISPIGYSSLDFSSGSKFYGQFNNLLTKGFLDLNSSQSILDFRDLITGVGGYVDITTSGLELSHTSSVSAVAGSFVLGKSTINSTPLVFQNSSNGNSVTIQSGVTIGNYTITLPSSQGSVNSFLKNDGSGNLSWTIPAATLYDTLLIGNTTSTDILLGYGHAIKSIVTTPYASEILLTGGSSPIFLVNNSNLLDKSWIYGDVDDLQLGFNDNYLFVSDSKIELVSFTGSVISKITADGINNRISMGVQHVGTTFSSNQDSIQVLSTWVSDINSNSNEKFPSVLSSVNATFSQFVRNTVVLGGQNILATASNTVYLGNNVNINNAYNLPNIDGTNGYVLKTDGSGNVSWLPESSAVTNSLEQILLAGNTTGTSSINIENYISFEATGTSQSISGYSIGSPGPGFWYVLPGDKTSSIYAGSTVIITNTSGAVNDGTKTILNSIYQAGNTYFNWTGIVTTIIVSGVVTYAIDKGYLQLDVASQSNYYTLPNKSGTIALITDILSSGIIGPAEDGDYTDGIFTDFTSNTLIGTAVDRFNEMLLLLAPTPPLSWNNAITSISFTSTSYPSRALTTGSSVTIYTDTTPDLTSVDTVGTQTNAKVNTTGLTFSLVDQGVTIETVTLAGTATPLKSTGNIRHSASGDPYTGISGKAGFWTGITDFSLSGSLPTITPSSTQRTLILYHPGTDSPETFTYYIDSVLTVSIGTITASVPSMTSYISGVPTLTTSNTITSIGFSVSNVSSYFYAATSVYQINAGLIAGSTGDPDSTPTSYGETGSVTGKSGVIQTAQFSDLSFSFTVKGRNSIATYGSNTTFTSTSHRVDTVSVESSRKTSGSGSYPASGYNGVYDSTQSLVGTYTEELQLRNGIYVYPSINYTSVGGPNYSGASGTRWATFNIGSFTSDSSFTLNILGSSGISTSNGVSGLLIEVKIEGSSYWVDGDSAFSGVGSPGSVSDGVAAVVVGSSTATSRKITFGTTTHTGDIIVRIGLTGTGIQFTSITATNIV